MTKIQNDRVTLEETVPFNGPEYTPLDPISL